MLFERFILRLESVQQFYSISKNGLKAFTILLTPGGGGGGQYLKPISKCRARMLFQLSV